MIPYYDKNNNINKMLHYFHLVDENVSIETQFLENILGKNSIIVYNFDTEQHAKKHKIHDYRYIEF